MAGESIWGSTEFIAAIMGATVGAVVGGIISFGPQIVAIRAAKKLRDEDQLQARRTASYSLIFKLIKITSSFYSLWERIDNDLKSASREMGPWSAVQHIVNLPDRVSFTSDEMAMLMGLKESALISDVMNLESHHNSLLDAMAAYGTERIQVADRMKGRVVGGGMVQANLTIDEAALLMPKIEGLNDLILHIHDRAKSEWEASGKTLEKVHKTLDAALKLGFKLSVVTPEATAEIK
jgi:hypothetical protein